MSGFVNCFCTKLGADDENKIKIFQTRTGVCELLQAPVWKLFQSCVAEEEEEDEEISK